MKTTTPLAKAVHTLEGQLVVASDVAAAALAAVDPSVLPPKYAGVLIAAQHIALLVQRGVIKIKASKTLETIVTDPQPLKALGRELDEVLGTESTEKEVEDALTAQPETAVTPDPEVQA